MDDKTLQKKHHIIIRTSGKRKGGGPTKGEYRNVSRRRTVIVSDGVKKLTRQSYGNQRLQRQLEGAPDVGHNSARNMLSGVYATKQ
jgi:hypothetical protein